MNDQPLHRDAVAAVEDRSDLYDRIAAARPADMDDRQHQAFLRAVRVGTAASLPPRLESRLLAVAARRPAQQAASGSRVPVRRVASLAACLLVALAGWWMTRPAEDPLNDRFRRLAALMTSAEDLQEAKLVGPPPDREDCGTVYWSESEREGFVYVRGLGPNDSASERYHVWVASGDSYTDAGMFDIPDFRCRYIVRMPVKSVDRSPTRVLVTIGPASGGRPSDPLVASADLPSGRGKS